MKADATSNGIRPSLTGTRLNQKAARNLGNPKNRSDRFLLGSLPEANNTDQSPGDKQGVRIGHRSTAEPADNCQPGNSDSKQRSSSSAIGNVMRAGTGIGRPKQKGCQENEHVDFLFFHDFLVWL